MNRFIRYWNQNRKNILITLLIVIFIFIIIKVINNLLKEDNKNISYTNTMQIEDTSIPKESVITGQEVPEEITNNNLDIIKSFVEFCNTKQYERAYNLLSDECKKEKYHTINEFTEIYCKKIFESEKTYNLELWFTNEGDYTYRVTYINNNILQTGNIDSSKNFEDYITVTIENKLNISSFIKKKTINSKSENEQFSISITNEYVYKDYTEYEITIKNNSDNTILISNGNSDDISITDKNDVKYKSALNENPIKDFEINPNAEKTIRVKFYKIYGTDRKIEFMKFNNIILDAEKYSTNPNDELNKTEMVINL